MTTFACSLLECNVKFFGVSDIGKKSFFDRANGGKIQKIHVIAECDWDIGIVFHFINIMFFYTEPMVVKLP